MGVFDGQPVSQAITNPAFINKNVDDVMPNILGFSQPLSGPSIANIQQAINNLYTATGVSESTDGTTYNATPNTIDNGDNYQTALAKLSYKFAGVTGHTHSGVDGDGPIIASVIDIAASGYLPATGHVIIAAGTGAQVGISGSDTSVIVISATGHVDSIKVSGNPELHGDVVLLAGGGVQLSQSGQNITIAASGAGGGGGGGGSIDWVEGVDSAIPFQEAGSWTYEFDAGLSQKLTTAIKVPGSYTGGIQIFLIIPVYSQASTGNLLFQTVATLIRIGTDVITDNSNQRTSTNSAIALSVGTSNVPQGVNFDLTSSTGQINGVNVSAGDIIRITLSRGTDTSTVIAKAMVFATQATFT